MSFRANSINQCISNIYVYICMYICTPFLECLNKGLHDENLCGLFLECSACPVGFVPIRLPRAIQHGYPVSPSLLGLPLEAAEPNQWPKIQHRCGPHQQNSSGLDLLVFVKNDLPLRNSRLSYSLSLPGESIFIIQFPSPSSDLSCQPLSTRNKDATLGVSHTPPLQLWLLQGAPTLRTFPDGVPSW